jgi:coenzyme F420 hydrogenase subunit beta
VDYALLDRELFGRSPHPESVSGLARQVVVAHAADDELRRRGSSGGLVSALLSSLLEEGALDGVLVMGSEATQGGWRERSFVARTPEEVRGAAKSKYLLAPHLAPLREVERSEGRYAVVGLPCHVHAVRNWQRESPLARRRIVLVVGLACNTAFEPSLLEELLALHHQRPEGVTDFDFRAGEWPGGMTAWFRNGRRVKVLRNEEIKDEINLAKWFFTPPRCNLCLDYSGEYADLAASDPWLRGGDGSYLYPGGWTVAVVRTEAGQRALDAAQGRGRIVCRRIPFFLYMVNFEMSVRFKRSFTPRNVRLWRLLGRPVPADTRGVPTGGLWTLAPTAGKNLLLSLGRSRWVRRTVLGLSQTDPALAFFRWNRRRKAMAFPRAYRRMSLLADRFLAWQGKGRED